MALLVGHNLAVLLLLFLMDKEDDGVWSCPVLMMAFSSIVIVLFLVPSFLLNRINRMGQVSLKSASPALHYTTFRGCSIHLIFFVKGGKILEWDW